MIPPRRRPRRRLVRPLRWRLGGCIVPAVIVGLLLLCTLLYFVILPLLRAPIR
jgi:hypothetical protein